MSVASCYHHPKTHRSGPPTRDPPVLTPTTSSRSASSSAAQGSKDFCHHVAVKRLIGRRCLPHQAWHRLSGVSGGLPGTRAAATYRVLLFLAAGCARARAPPSWLWRRRAAGGGCQRSPSFAPATVRRRELWSAPGVEPPMSLVCSCDSMSKRSSERQDAMVGVVPTEGRDQRRISVGLWLWLGAGAQVNIADEWK